MLNKNRRLSYYIAPLLAFSLASPANAALYLMVNFGDNEDREATDAAETFADANDGVLPEFVNSEAERYYIPLPGASMDTLSGSATRVGASTQNVSVAAAAVSMSESTMDAGSASSSVDTGDTGWIEYEAAAATLMYFSPDGLDEESSVRYEPARVFLRRFADGSVYVMITGPNGAPPAAD